MTLYAFKKNWQISPNNALAAQADTLTTNRTALLNMFNALLGLGSYNVNGDVGAGTFDWYDTNGNAVASPANFAAIRYTCNGSAVSSLGVNNITLPTHFVFAAAGNAHTWAIFDFTVIGVEVMIAFDAANASGATHTVIVSPYAATGNRFAAGTTTANPSTPVGAYTVQTLAAWGGVSTTNAALKIHVWKTDVGDVFEVIMCNGGEPNTVFRVEKPVVSSANWTNPSVVYCKGASAANSVVTVSLMHTVANFYAYAEAQAVTFSLAAPYIAGTLAMTLATAVNGISDEWDMYEQSLGKSAAPVQGVHGELNDVWWAPLTLVTTNISAASSPYPAGRLAVVGDQFRPWVPGQDFLAS
jgi:hypothetical protein